MVKAETKIESLEAQAAEDKEKLAEVRAQILELKEEKDKLINKYMDRKEFKDLMVVHDSFLYPSFYRDGWEAAMKALSKAYP